MRKATILAVERRENLLGTIKKDLWEKYSLCEMVMRELVENKKKVRDEDCIPVPEEPQVDARSRSLSPKEGELCYLQDRNLFFIETSAACDYCGKKRKTADHTATHCPSLKGY